MNNETKKKTGPKPKAKKDRVTALPIGVTGDQRQWLERESRSRGVNVSQLIRALIESEREKCNTKKINDINVA